MDADIVRDVLTNLVPWILPPSHASAIVLVFTRIAVDLAGEVLARHAAHVLLSWRSRAPEPSVTLDVLRDASAEVARTRATLRKALRGDLRDTSAPIETTPHKCSRTAAAIARNVANMTAQTRVCLVSRLASVNLHPNLQTVAEFFPRCGRQPLAHVKDHRGPRRDHR